ncbi:restriction endonuclease subunit S [Enterococcus casseliflavus]|jgi:type I restriction enzyme S subunit|uniref:restriction endonuclease subunit S n=1 Tax=Enterococcus casseliflavus TaxID=37734 RepID=UPI0022E3E220|nr:restriction endonuclease subunit S [Enterococcus casseliflavus]
MKYKFRDFIEQDIKKNSELNYGVELAIGVNIDKVIRPMQGNNENKDLSKFYIVDPNVFVYNPRGSRKLGLGFNDSKNTYITTFNNIVFKIKQDALSYVHPKYIFMYLSRKEWDRKAEWLSWGSSTEVFSWDTLCETEIDLPPLEIQEKYVAVYDALLANQKSYEEGLEDLKKVCDATIEKLRREIPCKVIGNYISQTTNKNSSLLLGIESVKGISIEKKFIETKANMDSVSLKNYLIVEPDEFAYVTVTSRNGGKISLAHNNSDQSVICSSSYVTFKVENTQEVIPSYLNMFFRRPEFDRYSRYNSWGSARETFDWEAMKEVKIPIPDIKYQQSIVDIYNAYITRREINDRLKNRIKDICPILIAGSVKEAKINVKV